MEPTPLQIELACRRIAIIQEAGMMQSCSDEIALRLKELRQQRLEQTTGDLLAAQEVGRQAAMWLGSGDKVLCERIAAASLLPDRTRTVLDVLKVYAAEASERLETVGSRR